MLLVRILVGFKLWVLFGCLLYLVNLVFGFKLGLFGFEGWDFGASDFGVGIW